MVKKGLEIIAQVLGLGFVTTVVTGFFCVLIFGLLGYLAGPLIGQSQARRKLEKDDEESEAPIIAKARGYKWRTAFFTAGLALLFFLLLVVAHGGGWLI